MYNIITFKRIFIRLKWTLACHERNYVSACVHVSPQCRFAARMQEQHGVFLRNYPERVCIKLTRVSQLVHVFTSQLKIYVLSGQIFSGSN